MVLNLHGEVPSDASSNTCVLNAEPAFLPHLRALHARFPQLRIVLEHATTREAVQCVKSLGDTVACTITAHHLALTVDDWAGQAFNFCKPVAKYPADRKALQDVVREGIYLSTLTLSLRLLKNSSLQATHASSLARILHLILPLASQPHLQHSHALLACTLLPFSFPSSLISWSLSRRLTRSKGL